MRSLRPERPQPHPVAQSPHPIPKPKKKLTPAQKREKKRRREEFETIFVNGKQKRVRRTPTIDGLPVDEFIERNADPIWLHQHGMWELMEPEPVPENERPNRPTGGSADDEAIDIPF